MSVVVITDSDNTFWKPISFYDAAFSICSLKAFSVALSLTNNPDGTNDLTASKLSPTEVLAKRIKQISPPEQATSSMQRHFWRLFEQECANLVSREAIYPFPGVSNLLDELSKVASITVVSPGPRAAGVIALRKAGLLSFINLRQSCFMDDHTSMTVALGRILKNNESSKPSVVIIGSSVTFLKKAIKILPNNLGQVIIIGCSVAGYTDPNQFKQAGATVVIERYDPATISNVFRLIQAT